MKIKPLIFVLIAAATPAQHVVMQTLAEPASGIRAIQLWKNRVYYAGSKSVFGFVNYKNPADRREIKLQNEPAEFRTLARQGNYFYTISIDKPATFYRVDGQQLTVEKLHEDPSPNAFYDALYETGGLFYTFSDPEPDRALRFFRFNFIGDQMVQKQFSEPTLCAGESAFAASNTNITSNGKFIYFATGGVCSRVFRLARLQNMLEAVEVPIVQGKQTTGIYSMDASGNFLIAAGGDYTRQQDNTDNIITSRDAGKTWTVQASGKNLGYKTCVKIRPGSRGKVIAAIGDQGLELSRDYGQSWETISTEKNLYTIAWINNHEIVAAGNKRIVKFSGIK